MLKRMMFAGLLASALLLSAPAMAQVEVISPNGLISATVETGAAGQLAYNVTFKGAAAIEDSALGLMVGGADLGAGVELGEPARREAREEFATRGKHPQGVVHYNEAVIPVSHASSGRTYELTVRVFEDGLAVRYQLVPRQSDRPQGQNWPEKSARIEGESTAWTFPAGTTAHYQTWPGYYEGAFVHKPIEEIHDATIIGPPATMELPGGVLVSITEAALQNGPGLRLNRTGDNWRTLKANLELPEGGGWDAYPGWASPWRVTLMADDLNTLVNSDIIASLCPEPPASLAGAEWIKPGRAVWSWWSENTGDYERHLWYVDKAAELGFEYSLVDEGWESDRWRPADGGTYWDAIRKLADYAREKGVGIWVWKRGGQLLDAEERMRWFENVKATGAVGVKIDFINFETPDHVAFYTAALRDAALNELMVNFHGANKPTGLDRTLPNEMTREGVKGLEFYKWARLTPEHNATLAFTRFLAGHADYTPCTFAPERIKASSFAHQLAMAVAAISPVTHWADNPERYLDSPAADVISAMPTVWDETRVLPGSSIGSLAAIARRTGDDWFVGLVNGPKGQDYEVVLSFLGEGVYRATVLTDNLGQHADMLRSEGLVTAADKWPVRMMHGGGAVARFERAEDAEPARVAIEPNGGLGIEPIAVTLSGGGSGAEIRYTLDDTEPGPESAKYEKPVNVEASARLRAAVIRDGKVVAGTESAAAFTIAALREPVEAPNAAAGLRADYYDFATRGMRGAPDLSQLTPDKSETVKTVTIAPADGYAKCAARIQGFLKAPQDGLYTLSLRSAETAKLWIGEDVAVNNEGEHSLAEDCGTAALKAGLHPIRIEFNYSGREPERGLELFWEGPGIERQPVPEEALHHAE